MSYGVKYRVEFKDYFSRDIKVDISEESYSSSVTSVTPTDDPLTIEWNGDREDIFRPVRGGLATINFYAETSGQFDEFFSATQKQYKIEVYVSASLYWTGWLMPGEHQEPLLPAPYPVSVRAYDLGYLQDIEFEAADYEDSTMLDAILNCLDSTGFSLDVKERVNVYEDSTYITSPAVSDSLFEDIRVHNTNFFSYEFNADSKYTALEKMLKPFNAFLMQENGVWNICRVGDMAASHNYRVFNSSGTKTSSGAEDTRFSFSSIDVINRSGLLMGTQTWRDLNFKFNQNKRGLIPNPNMENQPTATDLWTTTGTWAYTTVEDKYVLSESDGGIRKQATLKKTYSILSTTGISLSLDYSLKFVSSAGSPTYADIVVKFVPSGGGSTLYLDIQGGTGFSTTSTVSQVSGTEDTWISGTANGTIIGTTGTLSVELKSANHGVGTQGYTYFNQLELNSSGGAFWELPEQVEDLSKEIDTDNLRSPDDIEIDFGDANGVTTGSDESAKNFLNGVLRTEVAGLATDSWTTNTGAGPDNLQQICADCYEDQYKTNALRLQGTLRCQKNYLDVITYDTKQLLATSISRNFRDSDLVGEWIEIKNT